MFCDFLLLSIPETHLHSHMNTFIQPKTPRPGQYRWWYFIVLLIPLLGAGYVLIASRLNQSALEPPDWKVGRGTNRIVVRLPETPGRLQEDLLISGTGMADDPWEISRGPADVRLYPPPRYSIQPLTEIQWRQREYLRNQWCADPPAFSSPPVLTEPFALVFRCDETLVHFARFDVPAEQLPRIIRELLVEVPSPQDSSRSTMHGKSHYPN
jgi:hypothetical protein